MSTTLLARRAPALAVLLAAVAACSDSPVTPLAAPASDASLSRGAEGPRGDAFARYVAMGTSVSMGWRSDGVIGDFQRTSWPVMLAGLAGHALTVPAIAPPGCGAPLFAPIASGLRISGEAAGASFADRSCAGNEPGVTLPAANVAINGALTSQALFATPETPDFYQRLYADVLPSGATQLSAAIAQHPTLVSVEFGANEVLGARDGGYALNQTVVPIVAWAPQYHRLLDQVGRASQRAVLVGLIDHAIDFPSFRTGAELWAARASFAPFNVVVSDDCNGSANVLFVPIIVPTAAARGAYYGANFHVPYTLSCADAGLAPDGSVIPDNILSPTDMKRLDLHMAAMNAIIRLEALRRGYAYFPLGALYDDVNVKAPFDAITLMTSSEPYGPYISLDGIHPSAAGNGVLAAAAARALNDRYHLGIPGLALLATR